MSILNVDFLGYRLKNPLMLCESPLSGNLENLKRASHHELGLIFTKGIRPEPAESPIPYIRRYEKSLINADWSDIGFRQWLEVIRRYDGDTPLVTSIAKNYVTPDQAAEMAMELVKAGSRIISLVDYDPVQLVEAVKKTRPLVKVPLMVKLPPFLPNLDQVLKELVTAGVDAIAAMDSIGPVMTIDIETGRPHMGSPDGSGYLSGKYILPVTLKYIYEITRFVNLPVVGVGGVTDYRGALQMIMAGATGVGMVSAPMLRGFEIFNQTAAGAQSLFGKTGLQSYQ